MSLGGPVLRQHVVEFIDGTGVKTDGVVDTSDTATPFSWVVPVGVTKLYITGCGGGAGGSGGHDSATSAGGGGGGRPMGFQAGGLMAAGSLRPPCPPRPQCTTSYP